MSYEHILAESQGRVGLIRLNRPQARNAISNQLLHELMEALENFDRDVGIGAMVIAGDQKVFAAGADIKEMVGQTPAQMRSSDFIQAFARLEAVAKPVIAAVSGWALGGGCEIALACDMIVASETARFGQPEITIGVIPGGGGTQRLTHAVGKAIAMEMILNNRLLSAQEALQFGLVNRVVPPDRYLEEALVLAQEVASRAPRALGAAKRMIRQAYENSLSGGLEAERQEFFQLFASQDRVEGMRSFVEKRDPRWTGR
ncbi:MAG TPA: enoyl-CoA hydratase-related protein [Anaerolineales bacterium]|nr:enoyl-CoA hydratase-related protein [Anaerolineales bacterium]